MKRHWTLRCILKVVAVKAPDFGERRTLVLEDIAAVTGGTLISPTKGMKLDRFNMDWFGNARTVTVGKETTTIVDGRINERTFTVTDKNYDFSTNSLSDRFATLPTVNSAPIVIPYTYALSDGSTITGTETYRAISNYDYEFLENEKKRIINILNPDYAPQIENELKELLR